ncbi:histidinol dehydrogenase [Sedimentibacter hydroxybenzoicus DSM 7310]|uniref:Histidinol dehydrogenase n=1 Tax=Sedimentibacter hydroxybenzoicus DSM 7310 TaxID=1123245 RepID=A0A974GXI4_SEDHY|nr:histidinol dehydrogenase [Sedimentibacter hydroxybenzoicus]NYB75639.1 histidinol dehydrogenase [Sedimentibacter hydroxybenzoicus DSM 7310]
MVRIIKDNGAEEFLDAVKKRNSEDYNNVYDAVDRVLDAVRINKDAAVRKYTYEFDNVNLENLQVTENEIEQAFKTIDPELLETIKKAKENIEAFHIKQKRNGYKFKPEGKDILLGQLINPIEKAGIYVPGGKAAYPSTVLMNAIPAKIAGVNEIIMITPPQPDGSIKDSILVAASLSGVDKIFKVGGAQGIGALAYGTESIPKVYKITGPGNIYVAAAKRRVSGFVGIDMIAGPSEILIIADEFANSAYIAADMISQAEHDEMAASILVTNSCTVAKKVQAELEKQLSKLERREIIVKSLENQGAIIVTDSLSQCVELSNEIAPEHLELLTANSFELYKSIKNAGAIFMGEYSPEPVGDYFAGPNHTLPTSSTAKFSSALSVDDFIKKTSLIYYSKEALKESADDIIRFAENEGLNGHANAVRIRKQEWTQNISNGELQ